MTRVQARITLPAGMREPIDALREKWGPEKAVGNPAHVTIAYHDEATDFGLLAERLRAAADAVPPFPLTLGPPARFPDPVRGAFLAVEDPTGGVDALRSRLLAPPFTRRSRFGLHVTLLHPDQGDRMEAAWPELSACPTGGSFEVTQVQLVGASNQTVLSVRLNGPS